MIRGSGLKWDLRQSQPYDAYNSIKFNIPIGTNGDCYDRYLIRIFEMRESLSIIQQCLNNMKKGIVQTSDNKLTSPKRKDLKSSMESLTHHFKIFTQGFTV